MHTARLSRYPSIELLCTTQFSVACPLSYARGYPIPFHVAITCTDTHARDLLATYKSIHVSFMRFFRIGHEVKQSGSAEGDLVGRGRAWAVSSVAGTDQFAGEIPVLPTLSASFAYPRLVLSVRCPGYPLLHIALTERQYVIVFELRATGIAWSGAARHEIPVTITTFPAPGTLPRAYAPPLREGEEPPVTNVQTANSANEFRIANGGMLGMTWGHDMTI